MTPGSRELNNKKSFSLSACLVARCIRKRTCSGVCLFLDRWKRKACQKLPPQDFPDVGCMSKQWPEYATQIIDAALNIPIAQSSWSESFQRWFSPSEIMIDSEQPSLTTHVDRNFKSYLEKPTKGRKVGKWSCQKGNSWKPTKGRQKFQSSVGFEFQTISRVSEGSCCGLSSKFLWLYVMKLTITVSRQESTIETVDTCVCESVSAAEAFPPKGEEIFFLRFPLNVVKFICFVFMLPWCLLVLVSLVSVASDYSISSGTISWDIPDILIMKYSENIKQFIQASRSYSPSSSPFNRRCFLNEASEVVWRCLSRRSLSTELQIHFSFRFMWKPVAASPQDVRKAFSPDFLFALSVEKQIVEIFSLQVNTVEWRSKLNSVKILVCLFNRELKSHRVKVFFWR